MDHWRSFMIKISHRDTYTRNHYMLRHLLIYKYNVNDIYSLSRKTVNARENFWNVYCSATNQMRDETAKDNRQTAE